MTTKLETTQVGIAGEYLVAAELTLRGYVAAVTLRNARGIDIIASTVDGARSLSIQVKTNSSGKSDWILSKKSEEYHNDNHYYIFVALKDLGMRPKYYIVPSRDVSTYIATYHKKWLSGTKRDGSPRKDSDMRRFIDSESNYLERWDNLANKSE